MTGLKERLKDLETTIPGTIGLLMVALAAVYDAIKEAYNYLLSLGIRIEISEAGLLKLAIAAICIGLILSSSGGSDRGRSRRKNPNKEMEP